MFKVIRSNTEIVKTPPQIVRLRSNLVHGFITSQAIRCKCSRSKVKNQGHWVKGQVTLTRDVSVLTRTSFILQAIQVCFFGCILSKIAILWEKVCMLQSICVKTALLSHGRRQLFCPRGQRGGRQKGTGGQKTKAGASLSEVDPPPIPQ